MDDCESNQHLGKTSHDHEIEYLIPQLFRMEVKQLFDLLRKEAECSFCINPVNKPKSLPCLHSFCLDCLNRYATTRRQQGHTTFNCPKCLAKFQLPDNDKFDDFQTAFHQNRLLDILALEKSDTGQQKNCDCDENVAATSFCFECQSFLCSACLDKHNGGKVSRAHRQASLQNLQTADVEALIQRPVLCEKESHGREPLEYYCQDCRVCICHNCALVEHNKHSMLDIPRVAEQHKRQIIQDVEQMKSRVLECKEGIEKSKKNFGTTEQQIQDTKHKAEATMEELIRDLKEHGANIIRELDELHQTQKQAHLAQLENFELTLAQLNSSIEYAEAIVSRNMGPEILQGQEAITQRRDELLTGHEINPHKLSCVGLVTNDQLCQTVRQSALGRVVVSFTDPSRSVAQGKGLEEAKCRERAEFTVITKDAEGQQCYDKHDQVAVHIQTATQEELELKIEDKKDGTYHVTYVPQRRGQHHVMIKVNEQPLTGSPWSVRLTAHQYQAISSIGRFRFELGFGKGEFNKPVAVSVSSSGNIAVADIRRVQVFTSEGKYLRKFGEGRLHEPQSVAYTSPKHIIVVSQNEALLFTESGTFLRKFSPIHLKSPQSVSVTFDGRVIVCDRDNNAVKVLSPDGKELLQSFSAPNCSVFPCNVIYHKEKFFVSYYNEHCIKVYDVTGKYLHNIGSKGTWDGQLLLPVGIAIDKFGDLLVADAMNHRLQVFTTEGEFLSCTTGKFGGAQMFNFPTGITVSKDGRVYITDFNNHLVCIFK